MPVTCIPESLMSPGYSTPGRDELESMSATEQRIFHLQRQLDIETKVRQGAENMLGQFNTGTKDKKLLIEAEELLQDSKAKILQGFHIN